MMRKDSLNQKGVAPIVLVLAVVILAVLSILAVDKFKGLIMPGQKSVNIASDSSTIATPSAKASPTFLPASTFKPNKTSSPTVTPTQKPSSTPTTPPAATTGNSCPYGLTGPDGAIQINIIPNHDQVVGDQVVELHAKSGCKILEGRSTDNWIMIARSGGNGYSTQNTVTYSTVPAGSYSVRIQYKGQWTDGKGVDVVSTKLSNVDFTVDGSASPSTPTPTPKPKPVCNVSILPSNSGTAPYQASVCVVNQTNPYQPIQQEFADYDGDGNWDYQGSVYGCHGYTFEKPGIFNPKAKIVNTSGEESDVCQTSVTIN